MNLPFKTLPELLQYFNNEGKARDFLEKMRWPDGRIVCPYCGVRDAYRNGDCKTYKCRDKDCKGTFTVINGTVMENTKLPLSKWFAAIWLITNHKKGISSCQLARDLGIGQKAAWFLLHRVREMVREKAPHLLENVVAVDETHVGGKFANMPKTRRAKWLESGISNKVPVMGMVEKDGKARLFVIGETTFKDHIRQNIAKNTTIVTDEHLSYHGLAVEYKSHVAVNHSLLEFMKDGYSTNSVESFFSLFKRMYIGTYHVMSPYHLNRYCQEHAYRFNTRKVKDGLRFLDVMTKTHGRLKYKDLIAPKKPPQTKGINFINGDGQPIE